MIYSIKPNKAPDRVGQEAQPPSEASFLPQAEGSDGPLKRHRNRSVAQVKFTERHPSSLGEKNKSRMKKEK